MTRTIVRRTIQAAPEVVFSAVADVERLPDTIPDIVEIEFLSAGRGEVGTRFVETRLMNGKPSKTELEVVERVENERVRMVADSHGTVWDSVFVVRPAPAGTELELTMEARAHAFLPRLLNPLFKGLVKRGLEKHMDAVRESCEGRA